MSVWNSLPEALGHSDSFSSFKTSSQLSCVVTVPKLSLSLPSISGYVCVCVCANTLVHGEEGGLHTFMCVCLLVLSSINAVREKNLYHYIINLKKKRVFYDQC